MLDLGGIPRWNKAYCNLAASFIDPKECIQVYYDRCAKAPSIVFRCGSAVEQIRIEGGRANGVVLENGEIIEADQLLLLLERGRISLSISEVEPGLSL